MSPSAARLDPDVLVRCSGHASPGLRCCRGGGPLVDVE